MTRRIRPTDGLVEAVIGSPDVGDETRALAYRVDRILQARWGRAVYAARRRAWRAADDR